MRTGLVAGLMGGMLASALAGSGTPEARSLRVRLRAVRTLPVHRGDPVSDPAWSALLRDGAALASELAALVGDGTPMRDPRPEAQWTHFAVGDLALILLVDLGLLDFDAVVKPLVGPANYAAHGPLAYAHWVQQGAHRADLASAVSRAVALARR